MAFEREKPLLTEGLGLPLKIGRIFGILPIQEEQRGKFKIRTSYFTATLITFIWFFGFNCWYLERTVPSLRHIVRMNGTVVTVACAVITQDSAHVAISIELVILVVKCRDLLAIINDFGVTEVPGSVIKQLRRKTQRTVAFFAAATAVIVVSYSIICVFGLLDPYQMTFIPCMVIYCVTDTIFAAYNGVPQVYVEYLNAEIGHCLKTRQFGRLCGLQAKHGNAIGWIERLADCFGEVATIRVFSSFLLSLAAFVLTINGDPFEFGGPLIFFCGMAATVFMGLWKLYIICHYATANLDQVRMTSRIMAKVDTSCYNADERLQLQGFYSQLSNTQPEITSNGFFYVGKGLVLSFLGHVGTYVVVFLQFNQPNGIQQR